MRVDVKSNGVFQLSFEYCSISIQLSQKVDPPTDASRPVHLGKEDGPMRLSDLGEN